MTGLPKTGQMWVKVRGGGEGDGVVTSYLIRQNQVLMTSQSSANLRSRCQAQVLLTPKSHQSVLKEELGLGLVGLRLVNYLQISNFTPYIFFKIR